MTVLSRYVVYRSEEEFPTALIRFCKLQFPHSTGEVVCFFPSMEQMRNFAYFLRMVLEMKRAGLDLLAGIFMVEPAKAWLENQTNFIVLDDNEDLQGPVQEEHVQLGDGISFRQSALFRKTMKRSAFRALAASVEHPVNAKVVYEQDAVENPPYFTTFFDDYFEKNQRLLGLSQSVRKRSTSKGGSSTALAEPPVYAANLDGSLLSDECREFNLNALGTALDHLRPTIPGVNTPYPYFGMKGTSSPWHFEDQDLMSISYLGDEGQPKAAGSFVVTRYSVAHAVWNTGYNEACAVNLVDENYREVGLRVLRDGLFCTCDKLKWLRGEHEDPSGVQAFWNIPVERKYRENGDKVVVHARRRRQVVQFDLRFSREAFRAYDEYQQQVARIAQLEAQLKSRWCARAISLADDAPFDAQCLARWIGDAASGSVDDFMRLAGRAIAFAQSPVAPAPLAVAPGTASARSSSAPPTAVLGVAPVAGIDSGAVAPLSIDSAPPAVVLESSQEAPAVSSGLGSSRLLPGSHLKKIPLVLRSRTAAVAPTVSAAAIGPVAPDDAVMSAVRDVLGSIASRVSVADLIPEGTGSASPLDRLTDSQIAEMVESFPAALSPVSADDVDNELRRVAPDVSLNDAAAPRASSVAAHGRSSSPSGVAPSALSMNRGEVDFDDSSEDDSSVIAEDDSSDSSVVFPEARMSGRRPVTVTGLSKGARKPAKRVLSSSGDSDGASNELRCKYCGSTKFSTVKIKRRHEKNCVNKKCKCQYCDFRAGEQWMVDQHAERKHKDLLPSKCPRASTPNRASNSKEASNRSDEDFL